MYKKLQLNNALHLVNEEVMEEFKASAERYQLSTEIEQNLIHSAVDNWSIAFHIWCMFYEREKKLSLDYQKMMVYSCNFYCLQILKKNPQIQTFINQSNQKEGLFYILAYYLAVEMQIWVYSLLVRTEEGRALIEKNKDRHYFLLFMEQGIELDEGNELYLEQKLVISLLAQSFSQETDFEQHVSQAIDNTKKYFSMHKIRY